MSKPGYLYIPVPEPYRQRLIEWGQNYIQDEVLDPEGREDNPHITLLYGLAEGVTSQQVQEVAATYGDSLPTPIILPKDVTTFKNLRRSVLVVLCESDVLRPLSQAFGEAFHVPYTLTAHITLAYLQKSAWVKADTVLQELPKKIECPQSIVFCDSARQHHEVRLYA